VALANLIFLGSSVYDTAVLVPEVAIGHRAPLLGAIGALLFGLVLHLGEPGLLTEDKNKKVKKSN
jgi:hypothetical protein